MDDDEKIPEDPQYWTTESLQSSTGLTGRIGPYRIIQKLGEGGMGEVYEAEQEKPIRRKVALKVIRAGMDSKQVIARFESERQALALMDHPNIAKVFDAGTTPNGRPYFAMEYVHSGFHLIPSSSCLLSDLSMNPSWIDWNMLSAKAA